MFCERTPLVCYIHVALNIDAGSTPERFERNLKIILKILERYTNYLQKQY